MQSTLLFTADSAGQSATGVALQRASLPREVSGWTIVNLRTNVATEVMAGHADNLTLTVSAWPAAIGGDGLLIVEPVGGTAGMIVGPAASYLPEGVELRAQVRLAVSQFSAVRLPLVVVDVNGVPVSDIEERTLRFVVFDGNGTGVAAVEDADIQAEDALMGRVNVLVPPAATVEAGQFLWTLWDVSNVEAPVDLGRGPLVVERSCLAMPVVV